MNLRGDRRGALLREAGKIVVHASANSLATGADVALLVDDTLVPSSDKLFLPSPSPPAAFPSRARPGGAVEERKLSKLASLT